MKHSDNPEQILSPQHARWVVGVLSTSNFAIGMGAFIVVGVMTPVATEFALSKTASGLLLTIYALAYAIGSPLSIALTGRLSRVRVLTIGMSIFMVGALLAAFAPDPLTLYASRIVAALGAGMFTPVTSVVAMALVPPARRGKALAQVFIGFTLAQVLGVPIGSFIGYTFGWQIAFALVAVLSLLCLIGVTRLVPQTLSVPANSLTTLVQTMRNPPVMNAVMFTASYITCAYVLFTLIAPLLEEQMQYSRNGVTALLALYGLGAVLGNILGGRLTDRIGPYRSLIIACVSQTLLLPFFSVLPLPDLLLFAIAIVWSTFGWSFMVPQQARLVAAAPDGQSVVLALNAAAVYVGASVGSTLSGLISEAYGLNMLGLAAALCAILALFHLLLSERQLRRMDAASG